MSIRSFPMALVCFVAAPLLACSASDRDEAVQGDPQALTECDQSGTWAIKITVPVSWPATFVLAAGTGEITNYLKSTRTQDGLNVTDSAQVCGIVTPDYAAAPLFGSEKYGIRFADKTFEALPKVAVTSTLSSKEEGATYSSGVGVVLLGSSLPDPAADRWPTNPAAMTQIDMDNDTMPGITVDSASGEGFSHPPVNAFRTARADRIYSTLRQVMESSTGIVKSCNRVEGSGKIAVIGGKPAIDSHVLGCRREDGADCTAAEWKLLDGAAPVYAPTGDAKIVMVKLDPARANATCADIRALPFAE